MMQSVSVTMNVTDEIVSCDLSLSSSVLRCSLAGR